MRLPVRLQVNNSGNFHELVYIACQCKGLPSQTFSILFDATDPTIIPVQIQSIPQMITSCLSAAAWTVRRAIEAVKCTARLTWSSNNG